MSSILGGLFGGSKPQPQAVPIAPSQDDAAKKARDDAAAEAAAESKANGRRSTVSAGASDALLSRAQRNGAAEVLG